MCTLIWSSHCIFVYQLYITCDQESKASSKVRECQAARCCVHREKTENGDADSFLKERDLEMSWEMDKTVLTTGKNWSYCKDEKRMDRNLSRLGERGYMDGRNKGVHKENMKGWCYARGKVLIEYREPKGGEWSGEGHKAYVHLPGLPSSAQINTLYR